VSKSENRFCFSTISKIAKQRRAVTRTRHSPAHPWRSCSGTTDQVSMRTTLLLLLAVMAYVTGSVSAGNNWRPVTKTGIVPGGTVPTNAKLAWSAALAPECVF